MNEITVAAHLPVDVICKLILFFNVKTSSGVARELYREVNTTTLQVDIESSLEATIKNLKDKEYINWKIEAFQKEIDILKKKYGDIA